MKKYIKYVLASALVVVGIICLFPRGSVHAGDASDNSTPSSNTQEVNSIETNQDGLLKSQPLPSPLNYSTERQNLLDKLQFESQQGKVGYVALIGPMGQLVAYYTIKGKVSSLNSYLTTTQELKCKEGQGSSEFGCVTVDAPDLDGTYGANPDGIFFFTTSGRYVEWSGNYLFSDQPMNYVTQPLLVANGK